MELKKILAISKLPGLYQVVTSRDNGLIVTPLGGEKRKFVASRQHMFTPLENITVYTNTDSVELAEIFKTMKTGKVALPDPKVEDKKLRAYFTEIIPDHNQEKVYISDIKKMIKWFVALDEQGLFDVREAEKEIKDEAKKESKITSKKPKVTKKAPVEKSKKIEKKEAPKKAEKKSKK
jgi:hypothetical protein